MRPLFLPASLTGARTSQELIGRHVPHTHSKQTHNRSCNLFPFPSFFMFSLLFKLFSFSSHFPATPALGGLTFS